MPAETGLREVVMKKFMVEDKFWGLFPEARMGIVAFYGIDNTIRDTGKYEEILRSAEKRALTFLTSDEFSGNEVISVWREAFRKFKTKKGARSSIEALLKRVHKGNHIGAINPLVDLYNAISLKYALPCGGEDVESFVGDIRLARAVGDEEFLILGADRNEPPFEGEIIYKDDAGAVCRCWNWRESARTMLTERTRNAFLCIELADENRRAELDHALSELVELVGAHLGGTHKTSIIDICNKGMVIS